MTPEHEQLKQAVERLTEDANGPVFQELAPSLPSDLRLVLSRLAELERDGERLDAYEEMIRTDGIAPGPRRDPDSGFLGWEWEAHKRPLFKTFRSAMDAAMTTTNTKGEAE